MMSENKIEVIRLKHPDGAYIEVCNYGATWLSALMPDRSGTLGEVLLGYKDVNTMMTDTNYMGRTVGRYANRIRRGKFCIDGKIYQLETNDGNNSNHSGHSGLSFCFFDIVSCSDNSVTFHYTSKNGEGGFPANVNIYVSYSLNNSLAVTIDYYATTDAPTILNLTNHAYFNLNGYGDIYSHRLYIPSTMMLSTDREFLPTGELLNVVNTPFDFSTGKPIGKDIDFSLNQFRWNRGYNHCYVYNNQQMVKDYERCTFMAELSSDTTGRSVVIYSTYPSLQIYSGGFLESAYPTRFGRKSLPADGIALEAQFAPDTPNQPKFPQCTITPENQYKHQIIYQFKTFS